MTAMKTVIVVLAVLIGSTVQQIDVVFELK